MSDHWEDRLACAVSCSACSKPLGPKDLRILSSFTHEPICMECKAIEESREDYAEASQKMIGQCMADSELLYGDPGAYCYHHFYPFKC
ncbi:MAG: hypothetical protein ACOWWM_13090 [Desulfobacterales bacterium]